MARRRLWRNDVVRSYWRTRHPLLRFLCLHEAVTSPFVVAISDPITTLAIIHLHFGDCLSGTLFSSRWSAMEFRRCMPPCTRFIAREDPHSKCILCLGFSHAREAVYGTSNCKICDDFRLITLRSQLEDYERESSNFSRRASSTNAPPREAAASRRAASWGSDVELEEMESEQTGLAFSLPPSPDRARANSPVEFLPDFQFPSPKACDFVSFGLDDILHTAASDSHLTAKRRGLQRPTPSSWTCFRAPPKSLRWIGPMSPASLELRSSTIASSSARIPSLKGGSCHFSVICIARSPVPGSSHFPLALLTRQPLTSPTLWVLWSRVTPPCRWLRILWPHIFHPLWLLLGSPAPSFLPSRVGPLPPLSGSPTSRPVRQVWPFTQWPSFRPTRRMSWRKWTKGPAWLLKPWRSYEEPLTWLWEPPNTPHVPWGALWRLRWPQNAICGSTWPRFGRRKRCF